MKISRIIKISLAIFLLSSSAMGHAAVGFSREDLELVKDACLAGDSFDFNTEADGSISVKNLNGKGKLSVSRKAVTTVDLPDSDKRQEFKDIRECIKDYLAESTPKSAKPQVCPPGDSACCNSKRFYEPGECGAPSFTPR